MTTSNITAAATWLASTPVDQRPPHIVAHLKREFGLTSLQAVQAIRLANGGREAA